MAVDPTSFNQLQSSAHSVCPHVSPLQALTSKVVEAVRSVEININLAEILDGQAAQKIHLDRAQMILCMLSTCWWLVSS